MAVVTAQQSESPQKLWDREPEVAELERALAWAQHGEGGVLVLRGPAGIGKSSLLLDAQRRAAAGGMLVLAARAAPFERGFPYGVARQLFEPIVARGDVPVSELFSGAAARARDVLEDEPRELPSQDPSFASLHALYWLTSNLAVRAPLLVSVDDASWSDAASLRFLEFLVRRLGGMPVTLVLAYRTGDPEPADVLVSVERDPLAHVVEPGPLDGAAIAGMLSEGLSEAVDPVFCAACHETTGGNPLLVTELLRALETKGVRPQAHEVGRVRGIGAIAVGPAVRGRLELLGERTWQVARALAILGENVRREDLARTARIRLVDLEDVVEALTRAGIVTSGERVSFLHPLVAEAVRVSLSGSERARLHDAAAQAISRRGASSWELAPHLVAGNVGAHPGGVGILRDAARWALGAGAPDAAVIYLGRAVDEIDEDDLAPVLIDLGTAKLQAGDPTARDEFGRAIELARDSRRRALARLALSGALVTAGDYRRAAEALDDGIEEIALDDQELSGRMEAYLLANILMAGPENFPAAIGRRLPHARAERPAPTTVADRLVLGSLALEEMQCGAPASEVIALADQALATDEALLADGPSSFPQSLAISALCFCDELERVLAITTMALAKARARGSLTGFVWASAWRVNANLRMGRLLDAEADARAALDSAEQYVSDPTVICARLGLADSLTAQGRFDDASSTLAEVPPPVPPNLLTYLLLGSRASLQLAREEFAAAASTLQQYASLAESTMQVAPWRRPIIGPFPLRSLLARALIALGDRDTARALVAEELPLARAFGTRRAIGMTMRVAGLLEHGDAQLEVLQEATEQLAQSQSRLEYAASLYDYGAALRRANHRAEARAPLKAALQIAREARARPLQDRAAQELKATGARVSRPEASGIDALTGSEQRIAAIAATGMSNRDIAQALFVTGKTVETHLGHIYQKLNISGRGELPSALGDHGGSAQGTLDAQLASTTQTHP